MFPELVHLHNITQVREDEVDCLHRSATGLISLADPFFFESQNLIFGNRVLPFSTVMCITDNDMCTLHLQNLCRLRANCSSRSES